MTTAFERKPEAPSGGRAAGVVLAASTVVSLVLLANHPMDGASDFVGLVRSEAAHRVTDAVVHGGYIATMAVQLVCFSVLSLRLGLRLPVLAGLIFTAAGMAATAASLTIDGLVIPALAAQLDLPAKIAAARNLFVLCTLLIRFLMPMGLLFQAAGVMGWSFALLGVRGAARAMGVVGLALGALIFAGMMVASGGMALFGAIILLAIWSGAVAILLIRRFPLARDGKNISAPKADTIGIRER